MERTDVRKAQVSSDQAAQAAQAVKAIGGAVPAAAAAGGVGVGNQPVLGAR